MFTDQRLYRARAFEPVAGINEIICVIDQSGPIKKGPWFQVLHVEPVRGLGPHGVVVIWTQGTVAAGYTLPAGAPTGSITAGSSKSFTNGTIFQNGPFELTQFRWAIRPLALVAAVKEHDIDVQLASPGSLGRFGVLNQTPGFQNMIDQVPQPSDSTDEPAQAANMTQQTSPPAIHPQDQANLSEFFIWENNGPTWTIINNGNATLSTGTIGLRMWGFRYVLARVPVNANGLNWSNQLVMGQVRPAPARFTLVPTAPIVQTASFGG